MILNVEVHTACSIEKVTKVGEINLIIHTNAPATYNQANKAIVKLMAKYLNIAPSLVTIQKGHKTKFKKIKIET
ncbi:MAG: DUF167 domain-containing protein [bacterium]|nr:DUF167 domain-containing protein [bacterium]